MCKKPNKKLRRILREHNKEIKEETKTTVPHLSGLVAKYLRGLALSDLTHKKLEELL